jgi:hypothetical protein
MAKKLTTAKAKEILTDGTAQGHPLTSKQERFFGAVAGGEKPYADSGRAIKGLKRAATK